MIISHSRRFVFVHIHKTGGESITRALEPHLTWRDVVIGPTLRGKLTELGRPWHGFRKHSRAAEIRSALGKDKWDDYFTFSFVRHPVDRALSNYTYSAQVLADRKKRNLKNAKFSLPYFRKLDPLHWPAVQAYIETGSFSEFIRHPLFDPKRVASRPQTRSLVDESGKILVDFVGRFENLEADFSRVAERIGTPNLKIGWHNNSRTGRSLKISEEDREYLCELYEEDLRAFGYAPSGENQLTSAATW